MGQHQWSVSTGKSKYVKPRHYNHLTQLYKFILRKPDYFKDKKLSIFNHDRFIIDLTYDEVFQRTQIGWTEGPERKHINLLSIQLKREAAT